MSVQAIQERGDLPHTTVEEQLELLAELKKFPLGAFLVEKRVLNGYWTDYLLHKGYEGAGKRSDLEQFILNAAPTALATQERFAIFKSELQKRCHDRALLASVPCGLMSDLFELEYTKASGVQLIGVDLDLEAIEQARRATPPHLEGRVTLLEGDAWELELPEKADLITSNGLNIYEPDDARVVALYRRFYDNLKPGGVLVTSFLTLPPLPGAASEWVMSEIDPEAARLQRVIFGDILEAAWQAYRSSQKTVEQLQEAGFRSAEILYDRAHIFPTVVAYTSQLDERRCRGQT